MYWKFHLLTIWNLFVFKTVDSLWPVKLSYFCTRQLNISNASLASPIDTYIAFYHDLICSIIYVYLFVCVFLWFVAFSFFFFPWTYYFLSCVLPYWCYLTDLKLKVSVFNKIIHYHLATQEFKHLNKLTNLSLKEKWGKSI